MSERVGLIKELFKQEYGRDPLDKKEFLVYLSAKRKEFSDLLNDSGYKYNGNNIDWISFVADCREKFSMPKYVKLEDFITFVQYIMVSKDKLNYDKFLRLVTDRKLKKSCNLKSPKIEKLIKFQGSRLAQGLIEIVANAIDATNPSKSIGRFGEGFFQSLKYLENGGTKLSVDSCAKGKTPIKIDIKYQGSDLLISTAISDKSQTGTRVKLEKPLTQDDIDYLISYISSIFKTNSRVNILVNGEQINQLEQYYYINKIKLDCSNLRSIFINIDENGFEVIDHGTGMDSQVVCEKLLYPTASTKKKINPIGEDLEDKVEEDTKFFYKLGKFNRAKTKIRLQVSGVMIEEFSEDSVGSVEEFTLELPSFTWLPESRNQIYPTREVAVAIAKSLDKINKKVNSLQEKIQLAQIIGKIISKLKERPTDETEKKYTLEYISKHGFNPILEQIKLSGKVAVPGIKQLIDIFSSRDDLVFLHEDFVDLDFSKIPGVQKLDNIENPKVSFYEVEFSEKAEFDYLITKKGVLVNSRFTKDSLSMSILNTSINLNVSYEINKVFYGRIVKSKPKSENTDSSKSVKTYLKKETDENLLKNFVLRIDDLRSTFPEVFEYIENDSYYALAFEDRIKNGLKDYDLSIPDLMDEKDLLFFCIFMSKYDSLRRPSFKQSPGYDDFKNILWEFMSKKSSKIVNMLLSFFKQYFLNIPSKVLMNKNIFVWLGKIIQLIEAEPEYMKDILVRLSQNYDGKSGYFLFPELDDILSECKKEQEKSLKENSVMTEIEFIDKFLAEYFKINENNLFLKTKEDKELFEHTISIDLKKKLFCIHPIFSQFKSENIYESKNIEVSLIDLEFIPENKLFFIDKDFSDFGFKENFSNFGFKENFSTSFREIPLRSYPRKETNPYKNLVGFYEQIQSKKKLGNSEQWEELLSKLKEYYHKLVVDRQTKLEKEDRDFFIQDFKQGSLGNLFSVLKNARWDGYNPIGLQIKAQDRNFDIRQILEAMKFDEHGRDLQSTFSTAAFVLSNDDERSLINKFQQIDSIDKIGEVIKYDSDIYYFLYQFAKYHRRTFLGESISNSSKEVTSDNEEIQNQELSIGNFDRFFKELNKGRFNIFFRDIINGWDFPEIDYYGDSDGQGKFIHDWKNLNYNGSSIDMSGFEISDALTNLYDIGFFPISFRTIFEEISIYLQKLSLEELKQIFKFFATKENEEDFFKIKRDVSLYGDVEFFNKLRKNQQCNGEIYSYLYLLYTFVKFFEKALKNVEEIPSNNETNNIISQESFINQLARELVGEKVEKSFLLGETSYFFFSDLSVVGVKDPSKFVYELEKILKEIKFLAPPDNCFYRYLRQDHGSSNFGGLGVSRELVNLVFEKYYQRLVIDKNKKLEDIDRKFFLDEYESCRLESFFVKFAKRWKGDISLGDDQIVPYTKETSIDMGKFINLLNLRTYHFFNIRWEDFYKELSIFMLQMEIGDIELIFDFFDKYDDIPSQSSFFYIELPNITDLSSVKDPFNCAYFVYQFAKYFRQELTKDSCENLDSVVENRKEKGSYSLPQSFVEDIDSGSFHSFLSVFSSQRKSEAYYGDIEKVDYIKSNLNFFGFLNTNIVKEYRLSPFSYEKIWKSLSHFVLDKTSKDLDNIYKYFSGFNEEIELSFDKNTFNSYEEGFNNFFGSQGYFRIAYLTYTFLKYLIEEKFDYKLESFIMGENFIEEKKVIKRKSINIELERINSYIASSPFPQDLVYFVLFVLNGGEFLRSKDAKIEIDPRSYSFNLTSLICANRFLQKDFAQINDIDTLQNMFENLALQSFDTSIFTREIFSTIEGQDKSSMVWLRELTQNSRDAILKDGNSSKKIDFEFYNVAGAWACCAQDSVGMSVYEVFNYLLTPGESSKGKDASVGMFGQGFYSLAVGAKEIKLKTSNGNGHVLYLKMIPIYNDQDSIIDFDINIEIKQEQFKGTLIERLDSSSIIGGNIRAMIGLNNMQKYVGNVSDVDIIYNGNKINNKNLILVDEVEVPGFGVMKLHETKDNIERLTKDNLYISAIPDDLISDLPEWIVELIRSHKLSLDLPAGVPLTKTRNSITDYESNLKLLKPYIYTMCLRYVLNINTTSGVSIPMMPEDYFALLEYERRIQRKFGNYKNIIDKINNFGELTEQETIFLKDKENMALILIYIKFNYRGKNTTLSEIKKEYHEKNFNIRNDALGSMLNHVSTYQGALNTTMADNTIKDVTIDEASSSLQISKKDLTSFKKKIERLFKPLVKKVFGKHFAGQNFDFKVGFCERNVYNGFGGFDYGIRGNTVFFNWNIKDYKLKSIILNYDDPKKFEYEIIELLTHEFTHLVEGDKWSTHEKDLEHPKSFEKIQRDILRDLLRIDR